MKHSQDEIVNALKVIKETCDERERRCGSCPFYSTTAKMCHFRTNLSPMNWGINEQNAVWRAFNG